MRFNFGSLLLVVLLVVFPIVSFYYLRKGHQETLAVQERIQPKGAFSMDHISDEAGEPLSLDFSGEGVFLFGYQLSQGQLDSLDIMLNTFGDDRSYVKWYNVEEWQNRPIAKVLYDANLCYMIEALPQNKSGSLSLVNMNGELLLVVRPEALEDYQLLTRSIALRMPKEERRKFVFEKEIEK